MNRMLTFDLEGERFMYRVAGVTVIDGRVLVHQFEGEDDFYVMPGGRVEMREPAEEALAREMREELGCEAVVGRLLWVIDNHFTHRGMPHHELGLYFEVTLPEECPQASGEPWAGAEVVGLADCETVETVELYFQWKLVDELASLDLKPSCLKQMLRKLPRHTEYVVHRDS